MKQVTQKEVLETIEAKRESAENALERAWQEAKSNCEKGKRERTREIDKNKAYVEAYADAYAYIDSVKIVPEEEKKRQEDEKAIWLIKNRINIQNKEVDRLDPEDRKFMYKWLGWKLQA